MFDNETQVPRLFKRPVLIDDRGHFSELLNDQLLNDLGFKSHLQINYSKSKMNVIRGMHFQRTPHGQAKLVTCISGEIQDVVLNTELSSDDPTISYFDLSAKRGDVLFIPKGYAHGFQAKYEDTEVLYAVNATYRPDFEISINPLDPDLGIKWNRQPILSKKDSLGITYREWMSYKSQES